MSEYADQFDQLVKAAPARDLIRALALRGAKTTALTGDRIRVMLHLKTQNTPRVAKRMGRNRVLTLNDPRIKLR